MRVKDAVRSFVLHRIAAVLGIALILFLTPSVPVFAAESIGGYNSGSSNATGNGNNTESNSGAERNSNNGSSDNSSSSEESRRVVFVGDSRTVGMYITLTGSAYSDTVNATSGNETYIGRVAMGYSWFVSTGMPEASVYLAQGNTDLVILMGCNDMGSPVSSASQYASYVNANVEAWSANNNRVFFDSVNPVGHKNGGSETSVSIYSNDSTCAPFNETLKNALSDKVTWIDSYNYLVSGSYATVDGIHYDSTTYHAIHDYILQKIKESEKKSYTVSFDAAGGTGSLQEKTVKEGDPLGELPTPEREGYTFAGWYLDQTEVNETTAMPAKDITLKAAWKASDHTLYLVVTHIKSEDNGIVNGKAGDAPTGGSRDGADSESTSVSSDEADNALKDGSTGEANSGSAEETVVSETRYGTTGEAVTVQMPDKAGYVTPAAQTQTIAADGSTRFDFIYYPKTYKLTVYVGRGVRLSLNGSPVFTDASASDLSHNNALSAASAGSDAIITDSSHAEGEENAAVKAPVKENAAVTASATDNNGISTGSSNIDTTSENCTDKTDRDISTERSYSWTCIYGTEVDLQVMLDKGYENLQISGGTDNASGNPSATEFSMPDHDVELTLLADPITYHISYTRGVYDTAGLPDSYTVEDLPLTLKTPQMPALTSFEGWQNDQRKTVQSIPVGETGDLRLTGIIADYRAVAAADGIGIILLIVVAVMSRVFPSMKKLRSCQRKPNP
ncbi:MAG: InlB B-repeat-containing protein [Bilifractor sp.]